MSIYYLNKKDLPSGPWHNESDEVLNLVYFGLPALILRHSSMFTLNGYVGIPKTHPFWGKHYDDVNVLVHGGLTFANNGTENWGQEHKLVDLNNFWIFGFDCNHSNDIIPAFIGMNIHFSEATYKDIDFVNEEVKRLAEQLAEEKCSCGHKFVDTHIFGVCKYDCDCGRLIKIMDVLIK